MKRIILGVMALACGWSAMASEDAVLMTINGQPVMASEFEYIYQKSNGENALEKKTMDEYLDLFIDFKLKVAEAALQGVDTTEAFRKELKGYRAQAIPKYMQDQQAIDSLVALSYERMAHPRRAAHIAIQCPQNADDSTVAAAKAKIDSLRLCVTEGVDKKIKKGKKWKTIHEVTDFYDAAVRFSTDPNAQETKGEVGWVQAFRFLYPFEDAVYNTPVGQVTPVFRTLYGFHFSLVEEERDYEEVHAAHIMKMTPRGAEEKAAEAKAQIDSLYALILAGADFAELAKAESDDRGSAVKGGDLGWFGRGMMVQPFEDTAFALTPGSVSHPFQTRFGWHFIKQYDKRAMLPLDSLKAQILKNVQRDERIKAADASFLNKVRAEYHLPAELPDAEVRAYADAHLEAKYPELRHLVQEYHDGIMLFDVSLREVWDKAAQDTIGLTQFFKENKKSYTWDEPKYKGYVIYAKNENAAKLASKIVKNAIPDSIDSYLKRTINHDSTLVRIQHGLWEKGRDKVVDHFGFKIKELTYEPDTDFPFVTLVGKVIKAPQEYTDERSKVTTDYQNKLEKEWIAALRAKFDWKVNQDVFEALKK